MLRESVSGFDKKLSETLNLKIDQEGYGETTFTIPTNASWEGAHEKGKEGVPRYFYFKEVKSGAEFPRAYYVANPNKTDETDKINSKGNRITALMLKVAKDLTKDKEFEAKNNAVILGEGLDNDENNGNTCEPLIWGNKKNSKFVTCSFRKRVIEIAESLGIGKDKIEGANWWLLRFDLCQ
ncbi:hypothetical protein ACFFU9_10710 [Mariniflexile ostreae]|uniref:Uncharacterized protein n=1 Tax=Mariniflexile ostreae TaxID=1520892 RepID=A0ABV5FCN2_9FLAO